MDMLFLLHNLDEHVYFSRCYESETGNKQAKPICKFKHKVGLKFSHFEQVCSVSGHISTVQGYGRIHMLLNSQAQAEKWVSDVQKITAYGGDCL